MSFEAGAVSGPLRASGGGRRRAAGLGLLALFVFSGGACEVTTVPSDVSSSSTDTDADAAGDDVTPADVDSDVADGQGVEKLVGHDEQRPVWKRVDGIVPSGCVTLQQI